MKNWLRKQSWDLAFALLLILEACFIFYLHKGSLPNGLNESGLFACSLLIGVLVLLRYSGRHPVYLQRAQAPAWKRAAGPIGLLSVGFVFMAYVCRGLFREMPVDLKWSDIIPTIEVAVTRFLQGGQVYAPVHFISHSLPLTYLPLQWLPFTAAAWLRIDYRWVALALCFVACLVLVLRASVRSPLFAGCVAGLVLLCGWIMMQNDTGPVTTTVELMVAGYYILLMTGIAGRNPWWCGATIVLCLLSRYSLVLWLPLWAFALFLSGNKKYLFRALFVVGAGVLLLYVVPFLSQDWSSWWQGYQYYTKAALGEWHQPGPDGIPFQLNHGIGFARLFYEYLPQLPVAERLHLLQRVHLIALLVCVLLLGIVYWKRRHQIPLRIFLMGSFKIYLSVFFAFIQVPYIYLMLTATAVSLALFAEMGRWKIAAPHS